MDRTKGVYMLLDTSGTYTEELAKARAIVNYLLGSLAPGDTMAVARIDTGSFSEKDILAKVTFDQRPSVANTQKRAFQKQVAEFVQSVAGSSHTDISGGLLQAVEYLNEAGSGQKFILIFSDLKEELAKGHVRDVPFNWTGSASSPSTSPSCAMIFAIPKIICSAWISGGRSPNPAAAPGG
jgi:hypothetical protein